jgi:predicted metal-binding protein
MLCDTCDKPILSSDHQPARAYTLRDEPVLIVCGDCSEDIKADNVRTDDSKGSRLLNACISASDTAPDFLSGSWL